MPEMTQLQSPVQAAIIQSEQCVSLPNQNTMVVGRPWLQATRQRGQSLTLSPQQDR